MKKVIYGLTTYGFFLFLVYSFTTREQREIISWLFIANMVIITLGLLGFIAVGLYRMLSKDTRFSPNENGDFDIIQTGGLFRPKTYINLNAVGTEYTVGQEMTTKQLWSMMVARLTSGNFGTPPARLLESVGQPFGAAQPEIAGLLPARVITSDDQASPILIEARNIARDL